MYFRGVFHVHSEHSHDSSGSLKSIQNSAKKFNLDFVIITDHNNMNAKRTANTRISNQEPLMIFGNEISTTDGHLISLGTDLIIQTPVEPQSAIHQIHSHGGYAVVAHPICDKAPWRNWSVTDYDGIEVFNHACNFYDSNKISFALKSLIFTPNQFIKLTLKEPRDSIRKWDSILNSEMMPAFGAVDAHQKLGFLGLHLVRYDLLFRSVTLYVHKSELSEKSILNQLFSGRSFLVFESLGRVKRFEFQAQSGDRTILMGEAVNTENPASLFVQLDQPAEIRLMRNGELIRNTYGASLALDTNLNGVYRAEVFKNGRLWIISNPILINAK